MLPQALQEREEAVRNGKLSTIIFIRDRNSKGQEVSSGGGGEGGCLEGVPSGRGGGRVTYPLQAPCPPHGPRALCCSLLMRLCLPCPALASAPAPSLLFRARTLGSGTPLCQVSGYIDYGHRLASEAWESVFERRRRLMPRPSDLSYFNWETHMCCSQGTPNFQVRGANGRELGLQVRGWEWGADAWAQG